MKSEYSSKHNILTLKKFNYGLAILKAILAFSIIRTHNFNFNSTNNKILLCILKDRRTHVPSFFIMSFYFMQKELILLNINLFIKRIEKLLIPYFLWPIIIFIFNNYFLNKLIKFKIVYSFNLFIFIIHK